MYRLIQGYQNKLHPKILRSFLNRSNQPSAKRIGFIVVNPIIDQIIDTSITNRGLNIILASGRFSRPVVNKPEIIF